MTETILITGANRGIGLALTQAAVARGDLVIATARKPQEAEELNALASLTGKIDIRQADVTDDASLAELAEAVPSRGLDVLIANAGVLSGRGGLDDPGYSREAWMESLMTNVYGPFATVRALLPALKGGARPRVAIIASMMGSSARAPGGSYSYRASKAAAVNLARNLATDLRPQGVAVAAYHPGWVRTRMGGPNAEIDVEDSAAGLLARIDALTIEQTGVFEDFAGKFIPY